MNPPRRWPGPALALWALVLLAGATMGWLSAAQYLGYNLRSFDLGNMSQAIWSATQGKPLLFTSDGLAWSRLGLHVELIYLLLAPLYALWPSPLALLWLQAALYALGAWPLYRLGRRRLGSEGMGVLLAAIYLFYPTAQTAVLFQFHGDTLAMPVLLFALEAADRRAWRGYTVWLILALMAKFYVSAAVAAWGVLLWLQGERRAGGRTTLSALAWGSVAYFLVRPAFTPQFSGLVGGSATNYAGYYFGQMGQVWVTLLPRLANGLVVVMPALLLGLRAPGWFLPAAAVALPALLSTGPGPAYDFRFHHYALTAPFLLAAILYGAEALRQQHLAGRRDDTGGGYLLLTLLASLLLSAALVNTPLNPRFWSESGFNESTYRVTARDRMKDGWLREQVPASAAVIADDLSGSRLTNRAILFRTTPQYRPFPDLLGEAEVAVVDALYDYALAAGGQPLEGGVLTQQAALSQLWRDRRWGWQAARDGLLLFRRGGLGLEAWLRPVAPPPGDRPLLARFGQEVGLAGATVVPLGERRFRLQVTWVPLAPLPAGSQRLAVSRPAGLAQARVVHLPLWAAWPPAEWAVGQALQESLPFDLPPSAPPGDYPLLLGWYDAGSPFAAATDSRSRIGDEVTIGVVHVP